MYYAISAVSLPESLHLSFLKRFFPCTFFMFFTQFFLLSPFGLQFAEMRVGDTAQQNSTNDEFHKIFIKLNEEKTKSEENTNIK